MYPEVNDDKTGLKSVKASHMAQTWDVVQESNSQSYFEDSQGLPAMKHASFRLAFTSLA